MTIRGWDPRNELSMSHGKNFVTISIAAQLPPISSNKKAFYIKKMLKPPIFMAFQFQIKHQLSSPRLKRELNGKPVSPKIGFRTYV